MAENEILLVRTEFYLHVHLTWKWPTTVYPKYYILIFSTESNAIIIAETLCEGLPICESCISSHGGENTDPQSMDYHHGLP